MPPIVKLPEDLRVKLGITKVHQSFEGGQKYVFIVSINDKKFAIKMFRGVFGDREKRELNFYLNNSNINGIPKVVNVVLHQGETVVIEEYIDGEPLNNVLDAFDDDKKILHLIKDLCIIMEPIWKKGKTHRDLKPQNIIIGFNNSVNVIDFGIYKNPDDTTITETGFQPNSYLFAAPEQINGEKELISYRTDFFSLGLIAYNIKYRKNPFGST